MVPFVIECFCTINMADDRLICMYQRHKILVGIVGDCKMYKDVRSLCYATFEF